VSACSGNSALDTVGDTDDGSPGSQSVELSASTAVSDDDLAAAAAVAKRRLAAANLDGVSVTATDHGTLLVTGPAAAPEAAVPLLSARGVLRFRLVVALAAAGASPPVGTGGGGSFDKAAADFAAEDCASTDPSMEADQGDVAGEYVVACDTKGGLKYMLAPSDLDNTLVEEAHATQDPQTNQWSVLLTFADRGGKLWFDLTKQAFEASEMCAQQPDPSGCNEIAIELDGVVLSAPSSQQDGIPGDVTQITGALTEDEAKNLAAELAGGPMPAAFEPR
jgi:preprotein translocase subunit SecD